MALTLELVPDGDGWVLAPPGGRGAPSRYDDRAEAESEGLEYLRHRGGGRLLVRNQAGDVALTLRPELTDAVAR